MQFQTTEQFSQLAAELLRHHYLAQLAGTYLANPDAQLACIHQGIQPFEAVNAVAREYGLPRMEIGLFGLSLASPDRPLVDDDQLNACERLGLFELLQDVPPYAERASA
jgi:hypothetical protein